MSWNAYWEWPVPESTIGTADVGRILSEAAEEVLETMFFTAALGPAAFTGGAVFGAVVEFRGEPAGTCTVRLTAEAASELTTNFLGLPDGEVQPHQVAQVLAEFANMICGSVVSRVESNARIELAAPRPLTPEAEPPESGVATALWFQLDRGVLGLELRLAEEA